MKESIVPYEMFKCLSFFFLFLMKKTLTLCAFSHFTRRFLNDARKLIREINIIFMSFMRAEFCPVTWLSGLFLTATPTWTDARDRLVARLHRKNPDAWSAKITQTTIYLETGSRYLVMLIIFCAIHRWVSPWSYKYFFPFFFFNWAHFWFKTRQKYSWHSCN